MGYRTYSCPVRRRCGGCQWLDVPYPLQLKRKQTDLDETLGAFCKIDPIIGMENPLRYRNKSISPFAPGKGGQVQYGLFAEGSHEIVPADSCLVETEQTRAIMATVAQLVRSFKVRPYEEDRKEGLLRHVVIRASRDTREVMVTLVCAGSMFPSQRSFVNALRKRHPEVSTIVLNVNARDTNAVMGSEERVLFGRGWISDTLCGLEFRVSSRSFYQTNPLQTEVLYETAMQMASLSSTQTVIDAYCGIGTIGLVAARRGASQVLGVERNGDAVRDAVANARHNQVENARFVKADAADFMRQEAAENRTADVVFMDPPRAGASAVFLEALAALKPTRIVYISCNPATQARDVALLIEHGYRVERIQPVDMFPHTPHVETVALLTRCNRNGK